MDPPAVNMQVLTHGLKALGVHVTSHPEDVRLHRHCWVPPEGEMHTLASGGLRLEDREPRLATNRN